MQRKIRTSIATYIITATIFSAALAYSSSPIPFYKSFYAFAQTTQANAALSLSNLIKEGQPHQGGYSCNDGATYYIRQVSPGLVFWVGMSADNGRSFTNVFSGAIQGTTITGNWVDVPLGKYHNAGTLTLKADSIPISLHKISETGPFGGSSWNRVPPIRIG